MYFKIRRVIDTIIALLMLIVLSPLLLVLAIWVKLDSKGPVIFKQKRIGKDGKTYDMYKFRSMVQNAQNMGTGVFSFVGDPRITKAGAFLRKTSLDELPQLWNIVKGEMAFVGPRSPVLGHFPEYDELADEYKKRFSVLPGITGLAQCVGRNELSWVEKTKYDNIYIDSVKKYGIFYDIKIWFMTFKRVFSMSNIEETAENMEKSKLAMENMVKTKVKDKKNEI
jgi:lipopolysaccharide/colanic/teichoic acid biosynthesis glycosyltransferase